MFNIKNMSTQNLSKKACDIIISLGVALLATTSIAHAGGVALGATRVIYSSDEKQASIALTNSDQKNRFLVQSWIDDKNEKKSALFVLTPPLFVSKPRSENTLRIMYVGPKLPTDRESIFWLNSKAIPSVDRDKIEGQNVLQIAILSRIKVFMRPADLPTTPADALKQLTFLRQGGGIKVDNPSPYHITMVNINIGNQKLENTMISPKSSNVIKVPGNASGKVTYQTVNDYGANTPIETANIR